MMKRSLLFALSLFVAAFLVGCGSDKDRDKNKKDLPDRPMTPKPEKTP